MTTENIPVDSRVWVRMSVIDKWQPRCYAGFIDGIHRTYHPGLSSHTALPWETDAGWKFMSTSIPVEVIEQ